MWCHAVPFQLIRRCAAPGAWRPAHHPAIRRRRDRETGCTCAECAWPLVRKGRPSCARVVPFPEDRAAQERAVRDLSPRVGPLLLVTAHPPRVSSVETALLRSEAPPVIAWMRRKLRWPAAPF